MEERAAAVVHTVAKRQTAAHPPSLLRAQLLHTFLREFGSFDWDRCCLSLQGPIPLASFPGNPKREAAARRPARRPRALRASGTSALGASLACRHVTTLRAAR